MLRVVLDESQMLYKMHYWFIGCHLDFMLSRKQDLKNSRMVKKQ